MIDFGPEFDWLKALKDLRSGGKISFTEQVALTNRAGQWPTCACGELCKELPRLDLLGGPVDDVLYGYGCCFADNVASEQWHRAIETFEKIEQRTALLLSETTNNKGTKWR